MKNLPPTKLRLTKRLIESLGTPTGKREYLYDDRTPGFALCITPAGKRTFYFIKKINGQPIRYKLGTFPNMTPDQARRLAVKAAGEYVSGRNPHVERKEKRGEWTLGSLFEMYLERHAKLHKKTWREDVSQYNRYLKPWKNRKLSQITRADVQKLHAKTGQAGIYAANRLLALLSKMFNSADDYGWKGVNPCRRVKKFREKSRDRFLCADELPAFFEALEEEPNETLRDFLYVLILTGVRRSNTLSMRWEEVSLDDSTWRIPETKSGDSQTVHLPEAVVLRLKKREDSTNGSPWVFPGCGRTGHLAEPKMCWKRIMKRSGLKDVRLHDLRRTLGSWQAATGASLPIIGASLGHKSQQATAVYARLNLDPVRESVDRAAEAILAAGKKKHDIAK